MAPSIAVELVSVQNSIHANPGDQLMIYNGVCVGVYHPDGVKSRPSRANSILEHPPEKILAVIRTHGPSTSEQICNYLDIHMKDKRQRASVQRKIRFSMTNQGLLVRHPEDKRSRFPRYIIPTKPAAKAA